MEVLLNDLKVAVRRLMRDPLFAVVAILTLAFTFVAGSIVLMLVALTASMLPAWRAARTLPAAVLNTE